jgi:hypothetical protein
MGAAARTAALAHANTAQMARVIAAALQALPGAAP